MSPVNVTKSSEISPALKRIRNAPVTLVLIYATWCGHCHSYMPFFDKMSRVPGRTANTVKIEESELNNFNRNLTKNFPRAKSLEAEGYPTLLAVSREGEVMSQMPVVREEEPNTKMIRSVGNIAASMPPPKSVQSQEIATPNIAPRSVSSRAENVLETANNLTMPEMNFTEDVEANRSVLPPNVSGDISPKVEQVTRESEPLPPVPNRLVGGTGLYGALMNATYQLAPAAVLTGIAAGIPRAFRSGRRGTRKNRNSSRGKNRR
jgi:thiol-disulfide isomerase/thioredoxin